MRTLVVGAMLATLMLGGCFGGGFQWPEVKDSECDGRVASGLRCEAVAGGFEKPVLVTHAGDGSERLFVPQQTGRIGVLHPDGDHGVFLDISDRVATCHPEQGLLGLAFPPDHNETGRFYVTYTGKASCSTNELWKKGDVVLARFTVDADDPDHAEPAGGEELLRIPQPYRNHNGGHILFGPDGMLYMGVGDGGDHGDPMDTGGDPSDLLGSILRIDVSPDDGYVVPEDNPFFDGGGRWEVFAYGLRNPWRFTFADDGALWIADVGQDCFEEVDRLAPDEAAGADLGWSRYEGGHSYPPAGGARCGAGATEFGATVPPVHEYGRDGGACSVTGGPYGAALPGLEDAYLFSDFCRGTLWALERDGDAWASRTVMETGLQVTSFGRGEDGTLYLVHWGGDIHRLVPA